MDILITGINGFLGKNIAVHLSKLGYKITGIGTSKESELSDICEYHSLSVLNKELINKLVMDVDLVIHLAAITAHDQIVDNKFQTLDINLNGTKNILDAFNKSKRAKKFIYASSGKVYGKITNLPLNEESETSPKNILGKSKLIAEKVIDFYSMKSKTYIVFRIFQAYGPGQLKNFLIPTIISQINFNYKKSQSVTLGDIKAERDYIFIDDISSAFTAAINSKLPEGINIYNLSSSIPKSANDLVLLIARLFDLNIQINIDKNLLRHDEDSIEYASYKKAYNELGWKPKISIEDGLIKTINNIKYLDN